jgi:hypothetical protein
MCFPAIDGYRGNTCEIFKMINTIAGKHIPGSIKLNKVYARYRLESGQTSFSSFIDSQNKIRPTIFHHDKSEIFTTTILYYGTLYNLQLSRRMVFCKAHCLHPTHGEPHTLLVMRQKKNTIFFFYKTEIDNTFCTAHCLYRTRVFASHPVGREAGIVPNP